jgi:hypothetical protein
VATLAQLENALRNADKAGDMDAARKLAAAITSARADSANLIPGSVIPETIQQASEPSFVDQAIGAGEAGLTLATGATGGAVGMIGGTLKGLAEQILSGQFGTPEAARLVEQSAIKGAEALTYAPRTQAGQEQVQAIGGALQNLIPVAPLAGQVGAVATGAKSAAPIVTATMQRAAAPIQRAAQSGVQAVKQAMTKAPEAATFGESGGAAAADLAQMRIEAARSLPVPVELTRGAATRNAGQLGFEKEQMKSAEFGSPLRQRAEENNRQILANFESFIDQTGAQAPDISATGRSVTAPLVSGLAQAKAKTRSAYNAANKSPEALAKVDIETPVTIGSGEFEITASPISYLNERPTGLKTTALADHAKQYAVKLGIAEIGDDGQLIPKTANVKAMEDWRREISQATGYDATDIRDSTVLKKLIDAQTDPVAGPLYQKAKELRRQQSERYENRAIIADLISNRKGMSDPKVAIDQVFNKTILGGAPEEIRFLKRVLQTSGDSGKQAWKELQGATVNYIRDQATSGMNTDSAGRPLVSTAKLHQVINTLDKNGRLDIVFGKQGAEQMQLLNEVVKYVNTVPPGTLINTSGTAGVLMAALAEAGAAGAMFGLPVPVVSGLRQIASMIKDKKLRAKITASLNAEGK